MGRREISSKGCRAAVVPADHGRLLRAVPCVLAIPVLDPFGLLLLTVLLGLAAMMRLRH